MKINPWISYTKGTSSDVNSDVIKITANDVPNNGSNARVSSNRTSYCYELDKKVRI